MLARFSKNRTKKSFKNSLVSLFYEERFLRILEMINLSGQTYPKNLTVMDLGCGTGHFSNILSLKSATIGLDVSKDFEPKGKGSTLDFIIADICYLPFKRDSADIIVCASVLEHMRDLNGIANEIKGILKKNGVFIAGYPVETKLFKFVWKLVNPLAFRFIDQSQTYWVNPNTGKTECYLESPHTHKQDYKTIRSSLGPHFQVLQREKLPSNALPDWTTYYECIKCRTK